MAHLKKERSRKPVETRVAMLAGSLFVVLGLLGLRLLYWQGVAGPRLAKSVLGSHYPQATGAVQRRVCTSTWLLATDQCPDTETWTFPKDDQFRRECPVHGRGGR